MADRDNFNPLKGARAWGDEAHAARTAKTYADANFGKDFGVLAYALAELQMASPEMTTAAQNLVAREVHRKFAEAYTRYLNDFDASDPVDRVRGKLSYAEYFARNRSAYNDVLGQPIDLSWAHDQRVPGTDQTLGSLLPGAFHADTVMGAMRWLGLTEIPGVITSAIRTEVDEWGNPVRRRASNNAADEIMAGWTAAYQGMYTYDPERGNFSLHFNSMAQKGIRDFRRAEREFRADNTPLSFFDSADADAESSLDLGGYTQTEEGEYLHDDQMDAVERASGLSSDGKRINVSLAPHKTASWGIDWNTRQRRSARDFITRIQNQFSGQDLGAADTYWANRGFASGRSANSLIALGIDPDSPAGRAGMQEGALLESVRRIFSSEDIYTYLDAVENGEPINLKVIQPDAAGQMTEQVLTIQPGNMWGQGRGEEDGKSPNFIERLAAQIRPHTGETVVSYRGSTWRRGPEGEAVYQPRLAASSRASRYDDQVFTGLYTTQERYSGGMYKNKRGDWELAPLSPVESGAYSVPVSMGGEEIAAFGRLYEIEKDNWNAIRSTYQAIGKQAYADAFTRLKNYNDTGQWEKLRPLGEVFSELMEERLPKDMPRPGSAEYNRWKGAEAIIDVLDELYFAQTGSVPEELGERTIDEFDAWVSSIQRETNPGVYRRTMNPRQLGRAARAFSSAGNYLLWERRQREQGQVERLRSLDPGGYNLVGRMRAGYPNRPGTTYSGPAGADWTPWSDHPVPSNQAAESPGSRKDHPVLPAGTPDSLGAFPWTISGLAEQTDNPHLFGRAPGRTARLLEELKTNARVRGGAVEYAEGAAPARMLPNRVRSTYEAPKGNPLPPLGPVDPNLPVLQPESVTNPIRPRIPRAHGFRPRDLGDPGVREQMLAFHFNPQILRQHPASAGFWALYDSMTSALPVDYSPAAGGSTREVLEAAYSSITNREFLEAFPLGSTDEDDWTWQMRGYRAPVYPGMRHSQAPLRLPKEGQPRGEDTYNASILGGDPDTEAMEAVGPEPQETGASDSPPGYGTIGIDEVNERNTDPLIDLRKYVKWADEADRQVEENSADAALDADDERYQEALSLAVNPRGENAPLSAVISQHGNERGFYAKGWGEFLETINRVFKKNTPSYKAAGLVDLQAEEMSRNLRANLGSLIRMGRKDLAMQVRLGEDSVLHRQMLENIRAGRPQSRYYREALQQVSGEYGLDLAWEPGRESELFDQIAELAKSNPTAMQAVYATFAPPSVQARAAQNYLNIARRVSSAGKPAPRPAQHNTPAPQRGDSHVSGNANLKWSANQEFEMRRGRGFGVDPVMGLFDPMMMENTPLSAQVAARGGGGASRRADPSIPKNPDLNALQNSIFYESLSEDQVNRLHRQVGTFLEEYYPDRDRFNYIVTEDATDAFINQLWEETRSAFGETHEIGDWSVVRDDSLPGGYMKVGGYVTDAAPHRQADATPEPPEAPPMPPAPAGVSSAGNGNGSPPPPPPPAPPAPEEGGRRRRPQVNRDPARFPEQPGAEGWTWSFSRTDPTARGGRGTRQVTAIARRDAEGNLVWMEPNEAGELEPVRVNRGFGRIWDEHNNLIHNVEAGAAQRYRLMTARVADPNTAPARPEVIREAANWPERPQEGWMLVSGYGGNKRFLFAAPDPDAPGQFMWANSARNGAVQDRVPNPGYGEIYDERNQLIASVREENYERYLNEQGKTKSEEMRRRREDARLESEQRRAEARAQRQAEREVTPPPQRARQVSAAFGRFNNAMAQFAGSFASAFLVAHDPAEFGETERGELSKLAAMNEYLAEVTEIWNDLVDSPPKAVDDVIGAITDRFNISEEEARPAAEQVFAAHQRARASGFKLKKENPMRRTLARQLRRNEVYDEQDVGEGPLGFRSHATSKVQDIKLGDIQDFGSPSLGEAWMYPYRDNGGELRWVPRIGIEYEKRGGGLGFQTTVDENQIAQGLSWAQNAYNTAMQGTLPSSPEAIMATLKERMFTELGKQMRADIDNAVAHGANRVDATAAANVTKEIGDHFLGKITKAVGEALGVTIGEPAKGLVYEGTRYDTRVRSVEDLEALAARSPRIAKDLAGRSLEEVHAGSEMIVFDEQDRAYKIGGGGVSSAGSSARGRFPYGPGSNNIWGMGRIGSMLYGGYLLRREWQMAVGSRMDMARRYGEGLAEYAPLLYEEGMTGTQTGMGFSYRQQAAESYFGRTAYQTYGAFMDTGYLMSAYGDSFGRMVNAGSTSFGVLAGSAITGSALRMGGLEALGGIVSKGGTYLAAGYLLGNVALEAYNTFLKPPGEEDVTVSSLWRDHIQKPFIEGQAWKRVMEKAGTSGAGAEWDKIRDVLADPEKRREYLQGYMLPEELDVYLSEQTSEEMQELQDAVSATRRETLEAKETLLAGTALQKQLTGSVDPARMIGVSRAAMARGVDSGQAMRSGAAYASNLGFRVGTPQFEEAMYAYAETDNISRIEAMDYAAGRWAQVGAQIQSLMGSAPQFIGMGAQIARAYGMDTQARLSPYASAISQMQQYARDPLELWQFGDARATQAPPLEVFSPNTLQTFEPDTAARVRQNFGLDLGAAGLSGAVIGFDLSQLGEVGPASVVSRSQLPGRKPASTIVRFESGRLASTDPAFYEPRPASVAEIMQRVNPFVGNVIVSAMGMGGIAGLTDVQMQEFGDVLSSAGMSNQEAFLLDRLMGGDMRAYSFQSWQSGSLGSAFFDRAGRSIIQHNGLVAIGVYNAWAPKVGLGGGNMTTSAFLGTGNQEIIGAFEQGGFWGLQQLANEKSYAASLASTGIQLRGIQLSENFYWGAGSGGTWDSPTAGSAWGIENRQLALQHQNQMASFADQWARMTAQNQFAVRQENIQLQRMEASHAYQAYQWGFQYNQFQQSQMWAREDWDVQDTARGLQFGWQMEDLAESIRFASGRERKQLIRQRDRAALMHNLEEEQIETSRQRQEQQWALEDERMQKQKEYTEELYRLDQESYALGKEQRETFYKLDVNAYERRLKEYEEEKKLSDELRELQRKFQYDQLQLQKEAAGAQAAAAAAQHEINQAIAEGQKKWEELTGTIEQMNQYDAAFRIANATNEMFRVMDTVNTYRITKLIELLKVIGTTDPGRRWGGEVD